MHPDSLRLDFSRARTGFLRTIAFVWAVGLGVVLAVSIVLVVMDRLNWWRFWFNLIGYNVIAAVLSVIVYRQANKTWLHAVGVGRGLTISDITSDAVYSAGADTIITSWSKGAERILGYTADEAIGQSVASILPEDFVEREVAAMQVLFDEGIVTGHRTFNVRKNGEVFPTEASMTLLRDPDGGPAGFLTVLRDRSHQVQIENELMHIRDEMALRADSESIEPGSADGSGTGDTSGPEDGAKKSSDATRTAAEATVSALAAVAERRDPYTAGHQQRVSQLATAIALEMGLPDDQVEGIRIAGILHDTGKVVIPGEILSKPTSLSEFEFGIIKTHPRVDSEIVEGIDFPWPVARTVLQHHERLDGSGYPNGTKGEDILIEARILAVADVVEAMSSHRPYRPALGVSKALEEIVEGKGTRYDENVVEACINLFEENRFDLG
jgi:PAS domain S-box-containing protein